jgi:glycosyltransferase involved in cell wall biosynthesis
MSNKPLSLSIVIPVFNEERYIRACLDAISRQSVKPDEVIVVDNNSSDKSVTIAKKYKFVRIIKEQRQGIVFARNAGFNTAKSQLIGRIDADTVLEKEWVETAKNYFCAHKHADAVTGPATFYDFPFKRTTSILHVFIYYQLQKIFAGTEILWGSNMALRSRAWKSVRRDCSLDTAIDEDIDLALRLKDKGCKIRRISAMRPGVSMRRGNYNPVEIKKYLSTWHRTYIANKKYFSAAFFYIMEWVIVVMSVLGYVFQRILFRPVKKYVGAIIFP